MNNEQNKNDYGGWFFFEVVGLFLIILCVLFFGNSIWQKITQLSILRNINVSISNQIQNPSGQAVPLQEVKNLGYDFYVGQIDDPNTNDLTDDLKNQITQIVYNAHFPESMLQNMPIIILNSLDVTGNQYISIDGKNLDVGTLGPEFLSEGGFYETYQNGATAIFINKTTLIQNNLTGILTHELGHAVGSTLTPQDWQKFYQLRDIASGTPQETGNWYLSPAEDFAEVYKNTFTGLDIMTHYGINSSAAKQTLLNVNEGNEAKYAQVLAQEQAKAAVIREVLSQNKISNPTSIDYSADSVYLYTVSQATKDFIVGIMNQLNK
jgi:hypothetical protein